MGALVQAISNRRPPKIGLANRGHVLARQKSIRRKALVVVSEDSIAAGSRGAFLPAWKSSTLWRARRDDNPRLGRTASDNDPNVSIAQMMPAGSGAKPPRSI
jgi:hypothetical protein